jgi:CheY-like chemotaxis protein
MGNLVLIVDDEADLREAFRDVLQEHGFMVTQAASGNGALRYLKSDGPRPAAVVLDLQMPDMTGWELLALMKGSPTLSQIPVVITTAMEPARPAIADVVADFLVKPINEEELLAAVENAIASCAQSASGTPPLLVSARTG